MIKRFGLSLIVAALLALGSTAHAGAPYVKQWPQRVSGTGVVQTIVPGTGITVNSLDPANPIVSATGGSGVTSAVAGTGIAVSGATGAVTFSLATTADQRLLGNVSGGVAAPIPLTQAQVATFLGSSFLIPGNNLSDVGSTTTAKTNLGLVAVASSGSAADLSTGTLLAARMPALTGAITTSVGTVATTLTNKVILQGTTDSTASNAQFLGALATGLIKNTTTTGVLSIAAAGTDYQVPLTFSTGLVNTSNTITWSLAAGLSGGQTMTCGTGSGDGCTWSTTSNATKGKFTVGSTSVFTVDENAVQLSMGAGGGTNASTIRLSKSVSGTEYNGFSVENPSTSAGSFTSMRVGNEATANSTYLTLSQLGTSYGNLVSLGSQNSSSLIECIGTGNLILSSRAGALLFTTSTLTLRAQITSAGSFVQGLGLATGATDGFIYENGMNGNPSGTPTTLNSGHSIAETYDYANDRLDFYNNANSAWRGVPLATSVAAGSQTLLQTNGPAGITSTTPKWETFKDSAGVVSFREYWQ